MSRSTDRNRFKREAEVRYPYRVDIEVPDHGLGQCLNAMHDWCRLHGGDWAQHGYSERRAGQAPREVARFYFAINGHALAFLAAFGGVMAEKEC
ncbi:MAG: hypothetical protein KDE63_11360 [Novosphingobium sp.]|nr:hypothetical protein [Novosphingobium sp.]MCC2098815.1 hypothetical protein [Hyphomicrobiales bacterium]